jgi:hypothetical protein
MQPLPCYRLCLHARSQNVLCLVNTAAAKMTAHRGAVKKQTAGNSGHMAASLTASPLLPPTLTLLETLQAGREQVWHALHGLWSRVLLLTHGTYKLVLCTGVRIIVLARSYSINHCPHRSSRDTCSRFRRNVPSWRPRAGKSKRSKVMRLPILFTADPP